MRRTPHLLIPVLILLCGCGQANPLGRLPISGEITLNNQPLARGSIEFSPVDSGLQAGSPIVDGKYSISTQQGLPPGDYIVRISAANASSEPVDMPGESNALALELIPAEYNSASTLKFTVVSGTDNRFDFNVPAGEK